MITKFSTPPFGPVVVVEGGASLVATAARRPLRLCREFAETIQEAGRRPPPKRLLLQVLEKTLELVQIKKRATEGSLQEEDEDAQQEEEVEHESRGRERPQETAVAASAMACAKRESFCTAYL